MRNNADLMRLFIAVDFSEDVKKYLRSIRDALPFPENAQFSPARDFHLTLKFLGECSDERRKNIESVLEKVPFRASEAALGPWGVFPGGELSSGVRPSALPHVIWVGIQAGSELLNAAQIIRERMVRLGFPEENDFSPHITLARVRSLPNTAAFLAALGRIQIESLTFPIRHYYLFQSELGRATDGGAVHTKLRRFPEPIG